MFLGGAPATSAPAPAVHCAHLSSNPCTQPAVIISNLCDAMWFTEYVLPRKLKLAKALHKAGTALVKVTADKDR